MLKDLFKFEFNNYWRNIDKNIFFGFLLLFSLGIFFSFSSTSSLAGERLNKTYYFFFSKHLIFTVLALFIMFVISAIETSLLKKIVFPFFALSFLLLILVPIIGVEVKGAKRWLDLYLFRLQPIELLKPFFILVTVKILTLEKLKNSQIKYLFSFLLLASVIILLIDQPDLGQSILLIGSWVATVFVSGVSLLYIFSFFIIFIISIGGLLFLMPEKFGYIINRLVTFLDPSKGDTLKVHYYSFLITISFIFIFARTINNKRLVSFISLTLLTSCFVFIMGFPKIESSNINFYLNDKNTFSNLCQVGKVILGSDKNCNQPVSICDHNLYAESISFETISEKKVRTISEKHILKMEDGNNNIISVNNPYDCVKNLENGILLYNPIGRDLKIPPLINILYFFISLFSGIFLKRIKTI